MRAHSTVVHSSDSRSKTSRSLLAWMMAQLTQFATVLMYLAFGGMVLAIWRRRFHWPAALVGLLTMLVGVCGATMLSQHETWEPAVRDGVLWGGAMVAMLLAGAFIGRIGRRLGFWEAQFATAVAAVVFWIYLARGWGASDAYAELFEATGPGLHILGPMWDRTLALGSVVGFLVALFGASIAFLFYSETGRWDAGFAMEWAITRRHLAGRSGMGSVTAVVAVLGIGLGVASLVAVTAVFHPGREHGIHWSV